MVKISQWMIIKSKELVSKNFKTSDVDESEVLIRFNEYFGNSLISSILINRLIVTGYFVRVLDFESNKIMLRRC